MTGLSCAEVVSLLTDWLDGSLPGEQAARVSEHLAACADCERYVEQLRATVAALGQVSVDHLSPATREGLVQAFRNWPRR